jgi:hypothetical protein
MAMPDEPTNDERLALLRGELGRISRRRQRGKPLKRKPLKVPKHASQVKDPNGSTVAFHWTEPAPCIRQGGAGRRVRVALPRRSAHGNRRRPARRAERATCGSSSSGDPPSSEADGDPPGSRPPDFSFADFYALTARLSPPARAFLFELLDERWREACWRALRDDLGVYR